MYNPTPIKRNDSFKSNYWEGYSPTLKRDVCFLGQINYEYWLLLELNPEVITFCERPITLKGIVNNKSKKMIPNFWVEYKDGTESFVVISEKDNQTHEILYNWCQSNNYKYEKITNEDIRKHKIIINNAQRLLPYLNQSRSLDIDMHLVTKKILLERKSINSIIHELERSITPQRIKEAIYRLIFEKKVESDIYFKTLSLETEVWILCQEEG